MRDSAAPRAFRPLGDETTHYWLVSRMARRTDVDLCAAMRDGRLTAASWATLVSACRGCDWAQGCARWLDRPGEDGADIPAGCANRGRLAALRDPASTPEKGAPS